MGRFDLANLPTTDSLCHYVKLKYFKPLLDSQTFHATRIDLFQDQREGLMNAAAKARNDERNVQMLMSRGYSRKGCEATMRQCSTPEYDISRKSAYAVCFRQDETESKRPWDEYAHGESAVMIRTDRRSLEASLGEEVKFAPIIYKRFEKDSPQRDKFSRFFQKDKSFKWEREIRMLVYKMPLAVNASWEVYDMGAALSANLHSPDGWQRVIDEMEAKGYKLTDSPDRYLIPAKPQVFIRSIVLSPGMPTADREQAYAMVENAGIDLGIIRNSRY